MEIEKILEILDKNKEILNPHYSGEISFNVVGDGDRISIFLYTNDKKEEYKKKEKIKELFGAVDILYVEKDGSQPAFYSLDFQKRKI